MPAVMADSAKRKQPEKVSDQLSAEPSYDILTGWLLLSTGWPKTVKPYRNYQ